MSPPTTKQHSTIKAQNRSKDQRCGDFWTILKGSTQEEACACNITFQGDESYGNIHMEGARISSEVMFLLKMYTALKPTESYHI